MIGEMMDLGFYSPSPYWKGKLGEIIKSLRVANRKLRTK